MKQRAQELMDRGVEYSFSWQSSELCNGSACSFFGIANRLHCVSNPQYSTNTCIIRSISDHIGTRMSQFLKSWLPKAFQEARKLNPRWVEVWWRWDDFRRASQPGLIVISSEESMYLPDVRTMRLGQQSILKCIRPTRQGAVISARSNLLTRHILTSKLRL